MMFSELYYCIIRDQSAPDLSWAAALTWDVDQQLHSDFNPFFKMYCNSTAVGSFFNLLDTVATYQCVTTSCSCKEDKKNGSKEASAPFYQTRVVCCYRSSILCSPCAVPIWCKSFGNLNLGTLDAVDFICSMSSSARLSAYPGVIKGILYYL